MIWRGTLVVEWKYICILCTLKSIDRAFISFLRNPLRNFHTKDLLLDKINRIFKKIKIKNQVHIEMDSIILLNPIDNYTDTHIIIGTYLLIYVDTYRCIIGH